MIMAFLPAIVSKLDSQPKKKKLPTFKPRWWWRDMMRLDARPVIWSLKNHPEEWKFEGTPCYGYLTHAIHVPSNHNFYIGLLCKPYLIRSEAAPCNCQSGNNTWFHTGQNKSLIRAFKAAQDRLNPPSRIHEQFVAHFVR